MHWIKSNTFRSRQSTRTGFSLVEVLIGIGIVLAIAAIAVPWTMGWLGSRELDNAEDGLTMQMMMARAAAREEGRPVEVVAEFDGKASRINARWMLSGDDSAPRRSGRRDEDDSAHASIDASWATMQLPRGMRIALGLERYDGASGAPGAGSAADEPRASSRDDRSAGSSAPQTLAIFLPDGTVFFAPVFMLRTDAGTLRAMKVDRSTGVPQPVAREDHPDDEGDAHAAFDGLEDEFSPTDAFEPATDE